jgi:hypothetical protein
LSRFALEVGLQVRRVQVEVLAVEVDPAGVVAVREGLVERGAPAAQRVEHRSLRVQHPAGRVRGQQGDVEQQLGELLVGLPGVLGDRHQVVVQHIQAAQRDGTEQAALAFEQGVAAGRVGQVGQVALGQLRERRT